jgi:hypothetical protein
MQRVVLVTDRIYSKTRRHLQKLRVCAGPKSKLLLACVDKFPTGLPVGYICDFVDETVQGSVPELVKLLSESSDKLYIVALNQSAILPALALQSGLGQVKRSGFLECCDKEAMRRRLSHYPELALDFCAVNPGQPDSARCYFRADRYVVKPAFGMSSTDVSICNSWEDAITRAESLDHAKDWVSSDILNLLDDESAQSNKRIIEPYVEGTEFSIDGWIVNNEFKAIVQHKLSMVQRSFIGDGPTISPPATSEDLSNRWCGLKNDEAQICRFGRKVLDAVGFTRGVFHIEARE